MLSKKITSLLKQNWLKVFSITFLFLFFGAYANIFALPPDSPYQAGDTLDPICLPGDTNCTVEIGGGVLVDTDLLSVYTASLGSPSQLHSVFLGYQAGYNTDFSGGGGDVGSNFLGYQAGYDASYSTDANFLGTYAGMDATNASKSNFIGYSAGNNASSANDSNFIGTEAGINAYNAYFSNFIGYNAGNHANLAPYSNFIGHSAGLNAYEADNANFFGTNAGIESTFANHSNFLGPNAGAWATNASYSNFLGWNAGNSATNATNSNFIGRSAGSAATNASNSLFLGQYAGHFDTIDNTGSLHDWSILLGYRTNTGGFKNSILLGGSTSSTPISNTKANQFMLAPSVTEMRLRGIDYTLPSVQGGASTVLTNDGSGGLTWASAGGSYTFSTGLTESGGDVTLGGTLDSDDYISIGGFPGVEVEFDNDPDYPAFYLNADHPDISGGYSSAYLFGQSEEDYAYNSLQTRGNSSYYKSEVLLETDDTTTGTTSENINLYVQNRGNSVQNRVDIVARAETVSGVDSRLLKFISTSNTNILTITVPDVSAITGSRYMPLSVNGNFADVAGNITISGGATNIDELTDGIKYSTSVYLAGGNASATGINNVGLGISSLSSSTTSFSNTAVGYRTLSLATTGSGNTAFGSESLYKNNSNNNTSIGSSALKENTLGFNNSALGISSLLSNTTGDHNSAIGATSLSYNTTGNYNISLGSISGSYLSDGVTYNTTSDYSIYIGASTKPLADNGQNEIVIGYNAIGNGSNTATIGNSSLLRTYLTGVNLKAGTATAGTAPLKFTSGTLLTTPESGALEFDGTHFYGTVGSTRYQLDQQGGGGGLLSDADFNTKGGTDAGLNLVAGARYNTFLGYEAGKSAAVGGTDNADRNTAIGYQALTANTTGGLNVAVGESSMITNTGGSYNTALGVNTLYSNETGNANVALGIGSMMFNLSGNDNIAIGMESLYYNETGSNNISLGYQTMLDSWTGSNNIAIGDHALRTNDSGSNGLAIGHGAMRYANSTSTAWTNSNTAIGYESMRGSTISSNNTGNQNTTLGYQALYNYTSASKNLVLGYQALYSTQNSDSNVALGYKSQYSTTDGWENVSIGYESMYSNTTGYANTSNGTWSLYSNTEGGENTALGYMSMYYNTTGSYNTSTGYGSMEWSETGNTNSAFGYWSLRSNTTGSNNLALGFNAGRFHANGSTALLDPENSIYIGAGTRGFNNDDDNSIVVGYNAIGKGANTAVWGNTSILGHYFSGNISLTGSTPTARLHLPAGTTTASTAPLKLTAGVNLTTPEDGAMEYDSSHLYFTIGSTRYQLDQQGGGTPAITVANTSNLFSTGLTGTGSGVTTGASNSIFLGQDAGSGATYAQRSNFFGYQAGYLTEYASSSNFFGYQAGYLASEANGSNFLGPNAGNGATYAYGSNFLGDAAGSGAVNADDSNFFGTSAGYNATNADGANFFGPGAGMNAANARYSNFLGSYSGYGASNAANSIFIGNASGQSDTVNNTAAYDDTTTFANTSILIGHKTNTGGFSNSIAIGAYAVNTATNQMMVGSTTRPINTTRFQGATTECTITTGTGIACTSDETLKNVTSDLDTNILDRLTKVRTVNFEWLDDDSGKNNIGFLAQDLEQYFPELVSTDSEGYKSVYYANMTPILVEAIREMDLKLSNFDDLEKENTWRDSFASWFGNASNKITRIFTGEICLTDDTGDSECINKEELRQLKSLLNSSNYSNLNDKDEEENYNQEETEIINDEEEITTEEEASNETEDVLPEQTENTENQANNTPNDNNEGNSESDVSLPKNQEQGSDQLEKEANTEIEIKEIVDISEEKLPE